MHAKKATIAHTWNGELLPDTEKVELRWQRHGEHLEIRVEAPYHGDPPPPRPPGSSEGLWNHEVVELFFSGEPQPDDRIVYTEVELSPHGHYLVLRFVGVRQAVERGAKLELTASIDGDRWTGRARLELGLLPPPPWSVNAYAIHGVGADRRYLAMIPVPGERPDFHRPELFRPAHLLES